MKAAYYTGNKTFAIESVQPVAPGEEEVQVSVAYCGICGTDLHIYRGEFTGRVQYPAIQGHEFGGVIVEVGSEVSKYTAANQLFVIYNQERRFLAVHGSSPLKGGSQFGGIRKAFNTEWMCMPLIFVPPECNCSLLPKPLWIKGERVFMIHVCIGDRIK